jgi:hypothetical protein
MVKSHLMEVKGSPEQVFPLLCPVREYEWIDGWQCEVVCTQSGFAELDCVFRTSFPADGPEDTWVVCRYEAPEVIEFVRVNALRTIRYSIRLEGVEKDSETAGGQPISRWRWQQTITALNAEGVALAVAMTDEAYAAKMVELAQKLNHFLETGTMLKVV